MHWLFEHMLIKLRPYNYCLTVCGQMLEDRLLWVFTRQTLACPLAETCKGWVLVVSLKFYIYCTIQCHSPINKIAQEGQGRVAPEDVQATIPVWFLNLRITQRLISKRPIPVWSLINKKQFFLNIIRNNTYKIIIFTYSRYHYKIYELPHFKELIERIWDILEYGCKMYT